MKILRKSVLSWCMYDWANSAFALTVMAGFFPVFFKSFWCNGADAAVSTARLGFATTIAGIFIAVNSLALGAVADAVGARKKLLALFALTGAISTGFLFNIDKGDWGWALVIFIIANVGFSCANLFYDSLLIDVAKKEEMDFVSSMGYALGYLGCGLLFLLNVLMVSNPSMFHLVDKAQAVKISFLMASLWWLIFSIPLFLFVKENVYVRAKGVANIVKDSTKRLKHTFHRILSTPSIAVFLLAYWLYIDGVNTFVRMAIDFGLSIGFTAQPMMVALIVVQFVAFPSALLFGYLSQKTGPLVMVLSGIVVYLLVTSIGTIFLKTPLHFIILAGITGIAQGGIQALSRSYFGKLVPPDESAEYFGFFNIVSRFAVVGPTIVGGIAIVTHKAGLQSQLSSRVGMSSVAILFLAGGILLLISERLRTTSVLLIENGKVDVNISQSQLEESVLR